MPGISASVGRGGPNRADDVRTVQQLLNNHPLPGNRRPLKVDGLSGSQTIGRIEDYQKIVVKMMRPDGRVDPEGKTITALNSGNGATGRPGGRPGAPVSPDTPSAPGATAPAAPVTGARPASSFQVSVKGLDFLKAVESLRLKPYDDQTGNEISSWVQGATIGYGHLISQSEWNTYEDGITAAQANALFTQDLRPYASAVRSKVTARVTQNQFDAMVCLTFNIGIGGFGSSSVLKLVNDPSAQTGYPSLEAAWKAWNKSQGKVMQGLVNRRNAEWDIYSKNVYRTW